ncbi:MAG: DNA repair protein RadA [Candidatus Marinimicrobia bacterium]|nr:DNA repair protein RadA [Candidatus Neomarinimicrobiota bacterium]
MVKERKSFTCQNCGANTAKWMGQCETCSEWNTITEEAQREHLPKGLSGGRGGRKINFTSLKGANKSPPRISTGLMELDRVCGGGLVPGSTVLVGGDPGIGKSTILLQACGDLAANGSVVTYITGEEAIDQIRLRAKRLKLDKQPVMLATATNVRDIIASLDRERSPDVVVIDSIQTMYADTIDSAPGTITQVRTCSHELIRLAKQKGFVLFLVGHVTKEGTLAGPRVLEHMVDTVMYFEGDRGHQFRILRAVKNRYGPTDEIGVFEMTGLGLREVDSPSALFLAERRGNVSGCCVFAGIEGSRPVLLEIQALVAASNLGTPRRAVVGWDSGRMNMVIAVLEARGGLAFGGHDIYLNVAGGLKIHEPAADLAVATALISALNDEPVPANAVVFGEIGLSGEVRTVAQAELRLKEAKKMGFETAWIPRAARSGQLNRANSAEKSSAGNTSPTIGTHKRDLNNLNSIKGAPPAQNMAIQNMGHVQDVIEKFAGTNPGLQRDRN